MRKTICLIVLFCCSCIIAQDAGEKENLHHELRASIRASVFFPPYYNRLSFEKYKDKDQYINSMGIEIGGLIRGELFQPIEYAELLLGKVGYFMRHYKHDFHKGFYLHGQASMFFARYEHSKSYRIDHIYPNSSSSESGYHYRDKHRIMIAPALGVGLGTHQSYGRLSVDLLVMLQFSIASYRPDEEVITKYIYDHNNELIDMRSSTEYDKGYLIPKNQLWFFGRLIAGNISIGYNLYR